MTPKELAAICEALHRTISNDKFYKRFIFSKQDIAACLGIVSTKRKVMPEDMTETMILDDWLEDLLYELGRLGHQPMSLLGDYPRNAQASWRWTMKLIDTITEHPESLDMSDVRGKKDWDTIEQGKVVSDFMRIIRQAKFVFWKTEIFNAAMNGCESFVGERFDATEWWSPTYYAYDKIQKSDIHENQCNFGMLILPLRHDTCDYVLPIGLNGVIENEDNGVVTVKDFALEMVGQVGNNELIIKDQLIGQQLSAASAFLKMKVAAKERTRLPRPERRRMQREGKKEPELYTVSLRKTQGKAEYASDGERIERDSHWMVTGHWRRQWYPSVEKHAPLWIDGYIKGDTTKPFKTAKRRVFAAVR